MSAAFGGSSSDRQEEEDGVQSPQRNVMEEDEVDDAPALLLPEPGPEDATIQEEVMSPTTQDASEERGTASEGPRTPTRRDTFAEQWDGPSPHGGSPTYSSSILDETPSPQSSIVPSPARSLVSSRRPSYRKASSLQPFERRFSSRLSSPLSPNSPRPSSPGFLTQHSRHSSVSSDLFHVTDTDEDDPQAPWEVVKWTKLKQINSQVFTEAGKRNFGRPSCLAVSSSIVIGTSKGYILVFDFSQALKSIIGPGTKAVECGAVTAVAVSADYSTVAAGHAAGNIFTWEVAKPSRPFLQIPPLDRAVLSKPQHEDGHLQNSAVLHVGFLGTRHTALVSADEGGMAFSHLATRGTGPLGRSVRTTRLLGRYPPVSNDRDKPRKASSVLALGSLPLGNVDQATDRMGLTAILTPYLLVIVSTTPIAHTQYKASRPKDVAPHGALSGCFAWFPAVKLKQQGEDEEKGEPAESRTKLAYCWSNVLTVLDVEIAPSQSSQDTTANPDLFFRPRSRWRNEEAIVGIQWLTRSVLAVLTVSQRLIVLEEGSLRPTGTSDLLQRHIYHADLFSKQLQPVVEETNQDDMSLHGVVADAFYMSFRAYKGRLFLLGVNDVSVGSLSNWADRLLALMENGDFLGAIRLATAYFEGSSEKVTVGLPENDESRQSMVRGKIVELISASLKRIIPDQNSNDDPMELAHVQELIGEAFEACLKTKELDFLFEEVFEQYDDSDHLDLFFETLKPRILGNEIHSLPPTVLQAMITYCIGKGEFSMLEELICHLDTATMDINAINTLCKKHLLFDAYIYVWNQALMDYATPFEQLLNLIRSSLSNQGVPSESLENSAEKVFPYLAFTCTGRVYPKDEPRPEPEATRAKSEIYNLLLSNKEANSEASSIASDRELSDIQSASPLYLLLKFDTSSFMSMLNEAFEDAFLNDPPMQSDEDHTNGLDRINGHSGPPVTRQFILSVLLNTMREPDFGPEEIIFLHIFIARNLPKYPQFILLPNKAMHDILVSLCHYPSEDFAHDAQLSAEYLLSVYQPSDTRQLIPLFHEARFFNVLKSIYRQERQWARLLETYFEDGEGKYGVFDCLRECLKLGPGLQKKEQNEVHAIVLRHLSDLCLLDTIQIAHILYENAPKRWLEEAVDRLEDDSRTQLLFLRTLLDSKDDLMSESQEAKRELHVRFDELYIRLLCLYDADHVADYVSALESGHLNLDGVLPAIEASGVIDAAVVLLSREGMVLAAMDRLVKHVQTLQTALIGLCEKQSDSDSHSAGLQDLAESVAKYIKLGIWMCQGKYVQQSSVSTGEQDKSKQPLLSRSSRSASSAEPESLSSHEQLWLDLILVATDMTRAVSSALAPASSTDDTNEVAASVLQQIRTSTQAVFTTLLSSTRDTTITTTSQASTKPTSTPSSTGVSFLRVLQSFLTTISATSRSGVPTLRDLRNVLSDIFAAYAFEDRILLLAEGLLHRDLFQEVSAAHTARQAGWRPRGQVCELCGKRAWGPGVGSKVWRAWLSSTVNERERRRMGGQLHSSRLTEQSGPAGQRGKGKEAIIPLPDNEGEEDAEVPATPSPPDAQSGPIVVFACRHLYHRSCLEEALPASTNEENREDTSGRIRKGRTTPGPALRCLSCV